MNLHVRLCIKTLEIILHHITPKALHITLDSPPGTDKVLILLTSNPAPQVQLIEALLLVLILGLPSLQTESITLILGLPVLLADPQALTLTK